MKEVKPMIRIVALMTSTHIGLTSVVNLIVKINYSSFI